MREEKKNSYILRELIRIGVFSALWIVVSFVIACSIGFFPPVLMIMPCILGVVGGIIYMVMLSKLTLKGGMIISSGLLGICLYTMAPYGIMFICCLAFGILGEAAYNIAGRDSFKGKVIGICITSLGLGGGEYIPFIIMPDAYLKLYENNTFGTYPILKAVISVTNIPIVAGLLAVTVLCSFIGCLWGRKIIEKNFRKNILK